MLIIGVTYADFRGKIAWQAQRPSPQTVTAILSTLVPSRNVSLKMKVVKEIK